MTSDTTARHCGRRIVVAVLCCLTIGSAAAAQQRAYVSGRLFETCELSPVKPDCTRGVIRSVDTSTNQVVGSIDVWRTLTDGLAFHSLVMDPSGSGSTRSCHGPRSRPPRSSRTRSFACSTPGRSRSCSR